MLLAEFDLTSIITASTPLPITLLIVAVWHFKKRSDGLEERIDELQKQVVGFNGLAVALKNCPISEFKLRDVRPEMII